MTSSGSSRKFYEKAWTRTFITSVRSWQVSAVRRGTQRRADLASCADKIGKTPLHHCAGIDPRKFHLDVNDSLKPPPRLLRAGADVNAIRIISTMVKSSRPRRSGTLWPGERTMIS